MMRHWDPHAPLDLAALLAAVDTAPHRAALASHPFTRATGRRLDKALRRARWALWLRELLMPALRLNKWKELTA